MKLALYTSAAVLACGAAFAGGIAEPIMEPTPAPVVAVTPAATSDWTGFYAGLQAGRADAEFSFGGFDASNDVDAFGLHAGYMRDFGQFVFGGELSYDDLDGTDLVRLKARAGYDAGRFLPYVTLGASNVSDEVDGEDISETGINYGVGVDFKISEVFVIGAEYSRSSFEDVDGIDGLDLDADVLQARISFHF